MHSQQQLRRQPAHLRQVPVVCMHSATQQQQQQFVCSWTVFLSLHKRLRTWAHVAALLLELSEVWTAPVRQGCCCGK